MRKTNVELIWKTTLTKRESKLSRLGRTTRILCLEIYTSNILCEAFSDKFHY